MVKLPSIKKQLIILLLALAGYSLVGLHEPLFLLSLFITVISAVAVESGILYFRDKKLSLTDSSCISGLIIGFVLASDNPWWVLSLASILAILSKYLLRINRRHIFNPAAFGIFAVMILLAAESQWRETYLWYVLVPCGFYLALKIRKLWLISAYFLASFLLLVIQGLMQQTGFSHILGTFSFFFIFIMLLEPKTTPSRPLSQVLFGCVAAAAIFIFNNIGVRFDAELAGLLLANISVPLLERR